MNHTKQSGLCPICGAFVDTVVNSGRAFVHLAQDQSGPAPNTWFIAICLKCGAVLHTHGHSSVSASNVNWQLYSDPERYAAWVAKLLPDTKR